MENDGYMSAKKEIVCMFVRKNKNNKIVMVLIK